MKISQRWAPEGSAESRRESVTPLSSYQDIVYATVFGSMSFGWKLNFGIDVHAHHIGNGHSQRSFQAGHHFMSFEQRRHTRERLLERHNQTVISYKHILESYIFGFGKF